VSRAKTIYLKEHQTASGLLVAVCDKELLGQSFQEAELRLAVTERFYKGEEATEDEVIASLRRATIANVVGRRAVQCAVEHEFINEANVLVIGGVPHAQMVRL
jgi:hypothetical protein